VVTAINRLIEGGKIKGIDGIWITHYHDDHIKSVNKIRRDYGAEFYAQKELQEILEHPVAYDIYCIYNRNFIGNEPGYQQCMGLLLMVKPDMLIAAHFGPVPFAAENLKQALVLLQQRERLSATGLAQILDWTRNGCGPIPCARQPCRVSRFRLKPGSSITLLQLDQLQLNCVLRLVGGWKSAACSNSASHRGSDSDHCKGSNPPPRRPRCPGLGASF
jgi:hypothetical protein